MKKSYLSAQYIDSAEFFTYAHNKINAVIIDDIDRNGFLDLVTFPSNFTFDVPLKPIVWTNTNGVFSPNAAPIKNAEPYQYFRDSVSGDFNNDGYMDYFQADQGWELNNRDPNFFFGAEPALLLGGNSGLTWQPIETWLTNTVGSKTFNHIADAADYDRDGDLDVVVAGFHDFRMFQNNNGNNFTWREDILPSKFDVPKLLGDVSGTTFIELGDQYAVAIGAYRAWDANTPIRPITILTQQNGQFVEAYTMARPSMGQGRERNYGASEMFNMDMNGDGREDLVISWETEAGGGINDGLSNISGNPQAQRYSDLANTVVSIYFQDTNGRLVANNTVYNTKGSSAGASLFFEDFNLDGYVDFWLGSYGQKPSEFDQLVFINDGTGQFANPKTTMFSTNEAFPSWYTTSPFFFDANNDGAIDVVAMRPVFAPGGTHTIGQQLSTFLSDRPAYDLTANNKFLAVLSDRVRDGGAGIDTAIFSGDFNDYKIVLNGSSDFTAADNIVGRDGNDRFTNIERLQFDDISLALDVGPTQNAGSVYMLYKAAFNRPSDVGGMGYWIAQKDGGANIVTSIAQGFINSAEFIAKYGANPTNASYVNNLYQNVLGRAGEAGGVAFWTGAMDAGQVSKAQVLVQFATSPEGVGIVAPLIADGIQYQEWLG